MHIAVHVKMDMKEQTVKQVTILKSFAFEKSVHDLRCPRLRFAPIYSVLFYDFPIESEQWQRRNGGGSGGWGVCEI